MNILNIKKNFVAVAAAVSLLLILSFLPADHAKAEITSDLEVGDTFTFGVATGGKVAGQQYNKNGLSVSTTTTALEWRVMAKNGNEITAWMWNGNLGWQKYDPNYNSGAADDAERRWSGSRIAAWLNNGNRGTGYDYTEDADGFLKSAFTAEEQGAIKPYGSSTEKESYA
ncbi:MAG: hypothetical protein ACRCUS_09145, partial [Anaerovoracaceae bacterium]